MWRGIWNIIIGRQFNVTSDFNNAGVSGQPDLIFVGDRRIINSNAALILHDSQVEILIILSDSRILPDDIQWVT
ncbi:hypothetical protein CCR96_01585 [Halochromatium roseum]|nr:hypothetical protein [Halochromatium roseum]